MKIRIEIEDNLTEEEIIIRSGSLNAKVQMIEYEENLCDHTNAALILHGRIPGYAQASVCIQVLL